MNSRNFDREMEKIVSGLRAENVKPKLLLHSCCAPCSTSCIERLKEDFELTVYYYNPNIDTAEEYAKRLEEQIRFCSHASVPVIAEEYAPQDFYEAVIGLENQPEGGARCARCFEIRLKKTALKAVNAGFEYFSTTLTVSPLKNAGLLNGIGEATAEKYGVKFLPSDFKKRNGYKRSAELSKEYGLYRQNYCGCVFSKRKTP